MMSSKSVVLACVAVLATVSMSFAATFGGRGLPHCCSPVFGIPRGGGLFGGKKDDETSSGAPVSSGLPAGVTGEKYPAMTQEEVEDWLEHVPVYAVTDKEGQGVVLKPDGETSVFYFFMSPLMANATLTQLKASNVDMELRVSAFSLGKIWFNVLNADEEKEVLLKPPTGDDEGKPTKGVEYRLVPDTRDLLGARMLLTMNPEDGEKFKNGEAMTTEVAQAAIKKAMTESPKFNATYNEIPVFLIAQMRMQKQPEAGEKEEEEPLTMLPMYFSLQNMVTTWQQFMSQAPPDVQGVEPAINLLSLHDLINMMQAESEIDFRNVVLVPATPPVGPSPGGPSSPLDPAAASSTAADPMASMGGSTLGDL